MDDDIGARFVQKPLFGLYVGVDGQGAGGPVFIGRLVIERVIGGLLKGVVGPLPCRQQLLHSGERGGGRPGQCGEGGQPADDEADS